MDKKALEQFKKRLQEQRKTEFNPHMCDVLDYFLHEVEEEIEYAELEEEENE